MKKFLSLLVTSLLIAAVWGYFSDLRHGQTGWFLGRLCIAVMVAIFVYRKPDFIDMLKGRSTMEREKKQ
jgi:hypothetical protein